MLEKYMHIKTHLPYLPHLMLLTSLILGIVIGFIISNFNHRNQEPCKIAYISRDEILALEKTRAARTKDKQLFFGKTRHVIKLIHTISKTRERSGYHIIFTKGSYVRGKGVYSISEEIHKEVVQRLKDDVKSSKQDDNNVSEDDNNVSKNDDADEEEERGTDTISTTTNQAVKLLQSIEKDKRW